MEEEIKIKDSGLPYVKDKKGVVRDVSTQYQLEDGETWSNFEEYKQSQEEQLVEYLHNKFKVQESMEERKFFNNLKIDNYMDNVKHFKRKMPFFYNQSGIFWFWDDEKKSYHIVDEVDLMTKLDNHLGFMGQTVSSRVKSNYMEAFKRVGRFNQPSDAPIKWVQFKDKAYSLESHKTYDVKPNFFFTNPIPHEIGESEETPTMDKLFREWVGEKYVPTLYEIIAYCAYSDYPIQLLFCLYGFGRNGKSCFLRILKKFIGDDNVCSTSLDLITGNNKSRFESFKLYKKLVCLMGETNFGVLNNTSLIKQLTGGDTIGFEKKGKDPFDAMSYSKILIASNSLPTSEDTSEGFYRRWLIIDFPNVFPEGRDIIGDIPEQEYKNLAKKVTRILPELLERGSFTNQGEIEERKERYIFASNPLPLFIQACCVKGEEQYSSYAKLYTAYVQYLKRHKKRRVKGKEFKAALEEEGYYIEKTSKAVGENDEGYQKFKSGYWVDGISLKSDWKDRICEKNDHCAEIPILYPYIGSSMGKSAQLEQLSQSILKNKSSTGNEGHEDVIHYNCVSCGSTPCFKWDKTGKPLCKECYGTKEVNNV